jgi:hypothetical protein
VYETESSEWKKFNSSQRFRHAVWVIDTTIYMHGGFENETPNIPTNTIMKVDLVNLFRTSPNLLQKLELATGSHGNRSPGSTGSSTRPGSVSPTDTTRPLTPPLQSIAKQNDRIRIDKAEVVEADG